ncbi:hypothetical protein GCK72_015962 [Caenorhabditis remanei]|uniref:Uncharacterized protein n=1 Tax=Caenorhabditis remanei TaxID=31234 RepID=A0A6A5GY71_CAERE|nr:hypothetical protein GCK72_015962 [Caenorhabditis remanei]KAF1759495.1 hypothetical protein GCK72_015962 [Caenorhabditis remanei]
MNLPAILFLSVLSVSCWAALPTCPTSGCPPGGIWSEWTTTDNCPTSCGACSKAFYTRRCLTEEAGCPCTGNTTRYYPCNTLTCLYPAQRTCCIPYVPMTINGSMQCGPLPKEPAVTSCCPQGGLWSEWGIFVRNAEDTAFEKNRRCLTEAAGCSCVGESVNTSATNTCPCQSFVGTYNKNFSEKAVLIEPLGQTLDSKTCIYQAPLNKGQENCSQWGNYGSTNVIRYWKKDATINFTEYRMADCTSSAVAYFRAYCDFTTGYYRFYNTDHEILAWRQVRKL